MGTKSELRRAPPVVFPEAEPFWEAARENNLLVKHCEQCQDNFRYLRPNCPFCGSPRTTWVKTSGRTLVYSFTVVRGAPKPTAVAVLKMPEGPMLTSAIVNSDIHDLKINDEVQVAFLPTEGGPPVPAFTTVAAERARTYSHAALAASRVIPGVQDEALVGPRAASAVGAGTMGVGIALALLAAGISVCLIDAAEANIARAQARIRDALEDEEKKGRLSHEQVTAQTAALTTSLRIEDVAHSDLIIEADWEQITLKQQVFAQIDEYAKPGVLLGTNTSTLDIDLIAGSTSRAGSVIGLHFFSPANVMKLLEVIRGPRTDVSTVAAALALGRRLKKVSVLVGVCDGFVGNRLMIVRERQAQQLLLERALPEQVDRVLREFGLPMGSFELQDMAGGIELSYRHRQETGEKDWLIDRMFELGRLGQRAGRGYYRYEPGIRKPVPDDEVTRLIEEGSRQSGIERRHIGDAELRNRLILPMVNEGAKLVAEGIVQRASDIDVVWQHGFGWPDWKGGPMYFADQLGPVVLRDRLRELHRLYGEAFRPAPLIERMAASGERFVDVTDLD